MIKQSIWSKLAIFLAIYLVCVIISAGVFAAMGIHPYGGLTFGFIVAVIVYVIKGKVKA